MEWIVTIVAATGFGVFQLTLYKLLLSTLKDFFRMANEDHSSQNEMLSIIKFEVNDLQKSVTHLGRRISSIETLMTKRKYKHEASEEADASETTQEEHPTY